MHVWGRDNNDKYIDVYRNVKHVKATSIDISQHLGGYKAGWCFYWIIFFYIELS